MRCDARDSGRFPQGREAPARSGPQQGHGLHRRVARGARAPRALPPAGHRAGPLGEPGHGEPARQAERPQAIRHDGRASGPQRDALLPRAARASRRADADRLHTDGRSGVPGVRSHLPPSARALHLGSRPRARSRHPPQLAARGGPDHRRHGRRADSRTRRPGCGWHGHPHREALAVQHLRGDSPHPDPPRDARRRNEQRGAPRGHALPGHPQPSPSRASIRPSASRGPDWAITPSSSSAPARRESGSAT